MGGVITNAVHNNSTGSFQQAIREQNYVLNMCEAVKELHHTDVEGKK